MSKDHGRRAVYNAGCRCLACRAANAAHSRSFRDAVRGTPATTHGFNGYTNYACRCEVCVAANTARTRARRARTDDGPVTRRRWTKGEEAWLFVPGMSLDDIAAKLGRSYEAVANRRWVLKRRV